MLVFLCLNYSYKICSMPESSKFDLPSLQLKHPKAFFQRLLFSHNKIVGLSPSVPVFLSCLLFFVFFIFCIQLMGHFAQTFINVTTNTALFNIGLLCVVPFIFIYVAYAHFQATYSAKCQIHVLQVQLYLLLITMLLLGFNFNYFHLDFINIFCFSCISLSTFGLVLSEPFFKSDCSAIDRIKLQKLRQLAYWAYKESKRIRKGENQDIQDYFYQLHIQAMQQEQKLCQQIRFKSIREYLDS